MRVRKLVRAIQKKFCRSYFTVNLIFITGFLIGVYAHVRTFWTRIDPITLDDLINSVEVFDYERISSTADILRQVVRLHCVLLGSRMGQDDYVKMKWYHRCNSFSTRTNHSSYALWKETMERTYIEYSAEADWFIFTDLNSFVVPENARLFLLPFMESRREPFVFASWTKEFVWPFMIVSIGALNRIYANSVDSATRSVIPAICDFNSKNLPAPWCFAKHGLKMVETRDQLRRHRILPYPPSALMNTSSVAFKDKNVGELVHPLRFGSMCCSSTAMAILSLHPYFHGAFYHFIYIVRKEGEQIDYGKMTTREKLTRAMQKATEGLPPTVFLKRR